MRVMRLVLVVLVLAALAAGAAAFYAFSRTNASYKGYDAAEQFVEIQPGDGTLAIARKLVEAGVVPNRWVFRLALWRSGAARHLKAGEYRFDHPVSPLEVVARMAKGDVYLRIVTFPEGLTVREMARIFEEKRLGPAASFIAAARDEAALALVRDLDPSAKDLEGYLFPETYALPRRAGAPELVRMMTGRFLQIFTPEMRDAARASGLSVRDAVTLASLVEKETAKAEERPVVAGVYLHRLRVGMALQCDPTVIYALEVRNQYAGNLTHENLLVDSPYNTYRFPGLPPGPIASPGRGALAAAVRPQIVDYLYFVSRNDGSHVFARTLDEHNVNVRKFQVEYFRQKRAAAQKH